MQHRVIRIRYTLFNPLVQVLTFGSYSVDCGAESFGCCKKYNPMEDVVLVLIEGHVECM